MTSVQHNEKIAAGARAFIDLAVAAVLMAGIRKVKKGGLLRTFLLGTAA